MITMPFSDHRLETRSYPRVFVEVKPVESKDEKAIHALTADVSSSGLALYAYQLLPVGELIEICLGGEPAVIGEITSAEIVDQVGEQDFIRMGVRFINKKENWPL